MPANHSGLVEEVSFGEEDQPVLIMECLLELIIEEGFGLYNLFPSQPWSSDDLVVTSRAHFDIISEAGFTVKFYPPRNRRLLAMDIPLPDSRYSEPPTGPPKLKQ